MRYKFGVFLSQTVEVMTSSYVGQGVPWENEKTYVQDVDIVFDLVSLVRLLSVFHRRVNFLLSSHTNNETI